jgi:hypothetical protein
MSIATGRDPEAVELLSQPSGGLRLAIPQVCVMESFLVLKQEEKQRYQFKNQLDQQIGQLARDRTSRNAKLLLSLLQESNVTNQELIKDQSTRLFNAIEILGQTAELITISGAILDESRKSILIEDPADNLILHCILAYARSDSQVTKVFLTENRRDFGTKPVQDELLSAGVEKTFWRTNDFSQWLSSQALS